MRRRRRRDINFYMGIRLRRNHRPRGARRVPKGHPSRVLSRAPNIRRSRVLPPKTKIKARKLKPRLFRRNTDYVTSGLIVFIILENASSLQVVFFVY